MAKQKTNWKALIKRLQWISKLYPRADTSIQLNDERDLQVACMAWLRAHPDERVRRSFAVPNESPGSKMYGAVLKLMGRLSGVSDLFVPVLLTRVNPIDPMEKDLAFGGLWIELKFGQGKRTANQTAFMLGMQANGYLTRTCWTFQHFTESVTGYLESPETFSSDPF